MGDISLSKAVRTQLTSLQSTATMMEQTQARLATGNKVNSALDNPSNFFTASALNSRAADMGNLLDSMASGIKVIEAANNGLTALTKNLESMQSSLRQARQDKSFQNVSVDVTDASKITLSGGQLGETKTLSLADAVAKEGVKAEIQTTATEAYLGPKKSDDQGVGARSVITDSNGFADDMKLSVDGVEVTIDAAGANATKAEIETAFEALEADGAATKGKYTVNVSEDGKNVTIESKDPQATAAKVEFDKADEAVKASTTFDFAAVQGEIQVGGDTVSVGADFNEFVKNLENNAEKGGYTVTADADTKKITLTAKEYGVDLPANSLPEAALGSARVDTFDVDAAGGSKDDVIKIDGVELKLTADAANGDALGDALVSLVNNNETLKAKYTASYNSTTDKLTLTEKPDSKGAYSAPVAGPKVESDSFTVDNQTTTPGVKTVERDDVAKAAGAYVDTVAAATNEFTVTHDGKSANISIKGVTGGLADDEKPTALDVRDWKDATIASVNAQLANQGIKGVEAKFDDEGKFSIVAKEAEAKTVSVSGRDAESLFGADSVKTGSPEVSELKATKTTDKFVELINREFGSSVRASNDNGKLRIENLSTQTLDLGIDTNGVETAKKVGGNDVRANLAKQFNELRDQFDKLADDSSFNGINLLRGDKLTITFNETGSSSLDIQSKDKSDNARAITASNLGLDSLDAIDLDNDTDIDAFLGKVSSALSDLRSQSSTFGSNLSSVQNRQDFTKSMINTLEAGAANLTLADMNEEAANLLALQTRQSLSNSAMSMASQADQSILQLLR